MSTSEIIDIENVNKDKKEEHCIEYPQIQVTKCEDIFQYKCKSLKQQISKTFMINSKLKNFQNLHDNSSLCNSFSFNSCNSSMCLSSLSSASSPTDALSISLPQKFNDNYEILSYISKGCQGYVYKIQNKTTKQECVAKVLQSNDDEQILRLKFEFEILQQICDNKFFIKPIEFIMDHEFGCAILVEEYFEANTLKELISDEDTPLDYDSTNQIITQLLQSIEFLHENKIVHRDINLANILYSKSTNELKVIDFGVAKEVKQQDDLMMTSPNGNPQFLSPEIISDEDYYTEKIDEFGCGLVLLSMIQNSVIKTKNYKKHLQFHQKQKYEPGTLIFNLFSASKALLNPDFNKRQSASDCLKQFFQK